MKNKFLIGLIGPLGSGKTHIARILAKKLGAVHVRTDDIRVALRKKGKSYSPARIIAKRMVKEALASGKSVITDFDMVLSRRQQQYQALARSLGARLFLIKVNTPEKLILERLKRKKYTTGELFKNKNEAIRVYFIRRKFHQKKLKTKVDFLINNARVLAPQISRIVKKLKGP